MWWSENKRKSRITVSRKPKRTYHKETIGTILGVSMLFLALALFGYHHDDATWFFFASNGQGIINWCGILGAHAASLLLHLFGSGAYTVLFAFGMATYLLLTAKADNDYQRRLSCLPLIVCSSMVLFQRYAIEITFGFSGGLVGELLYEFSNQYIGQVGVPLIWWSILLVSLSIALNMSLFTPLRMAGSFIITCMNAIITYLGNTMHHQWQWIKGHALQLNRYLIESGDLYLLLEQRRSEEYLHQQEADLLAQKTAFRGATAQKAVMVRDPLILRSPTGVSKNTSGSKLPDHPEESRRSLGEDGRLEGPDGATRVEGCEDERLEGQKVLFQLPDLTLFNPGQDPAHGAKISQEAYARSEKLKEKLEHFGLNGLVTSIQPGPLITMFEYQPEISSKISKITALEDDLAMALSAVSIRTIAPIPGKNAVGFEIANKERKNVYFSDAINSDQFVNSTAKLPLALGVDVVGNPVVYDLIAMPHLLIGGTTGSGKSVGLNSMLASLLCRCTPEELRLILIDPKRLEFTPYADIPHLLFPIVTNAGQASVVLKWVVQEMEDRYERMSKHAVRNVIEYQQLVAKTHDGSLEKMPFIAVIIDELADLMVVAGKEIETHIVRIAQMARAAGIHLIVATQRPSVDVVTGLIKVNFPSRVAFRVASKVDSRTILDQMGAEKLLGRGDMLFMHSSSPHLTRIHGAYISDQEIEILTKHLREQAPVNYLNLQDALDAQECKKTDTFEDVLYPEAIAWIDTIEEVSISMLQRQFRIGFNRSARIIEQLEIDAKIAPAQGSKPRRVLK